MPIPVNSVIPLEAGSIVCGIVLTLLVLGIAQHGVSLKVIADSDRQRFLNVVCLSVVIAGIISLGLNQTLDVFILQNVCLMVIFGGVQLGLCCLNHNTLMRLYITYTRQRGGVKRASQWCLLLYPLSAIVLIPIYLAYPQTVHLEEGVNRAEINARVYKPLNVGLVFATELLATVSDVLLLRRINIAADGTREAEVAALARRNLWKEYTVVWLSVVLDVLLKLLIFAGQPVLFDSQVTNLTLVLRARTNLNEAVTKSAPSKSLLTTLGSTASKPKSFLGSSTLAQDGPYLPGLSEVPEVPDPEASPSGSRFLAFSQTDSSEIE
ncbi:hypothetical protein PhCBS80983_g00658 [Powellomyces hirtus]|uniref:G-protein coupled receptors family 1 profile domain-containing protein n=1 Tax=Powellomyces hirtus TaxID=109895 RepID=A0A507EG10_9FUNG|nr:hypothetical protein PhCBS80983_g00658 [Powellomyces hirtus]